MQYTENAIFMHCYKGILQNTEIKTLELGMEWDLAA